MMIAHVFPTAHTLEMVTAYVFEMRRRFFLGLQLLVIIR